MKVTLNWLKEFLNTDQLDAREVAELLTMSGSEVKKVEDTGKKFDKVIIGQITEHQQHPNADKLSLCRVKDGQGIRNIVCGAKNFKTGDVVALALPGAKIGDITLKRSKIRGQVSEGMMCSEAELGLSEESEGIMILDQGLKLGRSFAETMGLDDVVFELEITPNRPDCLSTIGIAREVAALKGLELKLPSYDLKEGLAGDKDFEIDIKDYKLCPRYSAKIFYDIPKIQSPQWLVNRLKLCDVRSVDLIVDLTNYVMLETGQPLHAFDRDLLSSGKIIVRAAAKSEKIRTIDDSQRQLEEGMIVIADSKGPVAIAGIMGGKATEVNDRTKNVLLEAANFSGPDIMRTSKKLGLRSEASNRFEKKIDPHLTLFAINRFEQLLAGISGQLKSSGIYDNYSHSQRKRTINLRPQTVTRILGEEISQNRILEILNGLGLVSQKDKQDIKVNVPSFRYEDLEREIDLVEEVARVYGFNNFKSRPPQITQRPQGYSWRQKAERDIRSCLADLGLNQVINYSFISGKKLKQFRVQADESDLVKIINPINEDFEYLRPTLFPAMLDNVSQNLKYRIQDMALFETSRVFKKVEAKLPRETVMLGILLTGRKNKKGWNIEQAAYDFYDLKGIAEYLAERYYPESGLQLNHKEMAFFHPVAGATVSIGKQEMGIMGQIHPSLLAELDIDQPVYYMELNLDQFIAGIKDSRQYSSIGLYPAMDMDIAIVVDQEVSHRDIEQAIRESGSDILQQVRLFDLYQGQQIEPGKKSMAYSLTFRRQDRTLKDREVEIEVERILSSLGKKFNATLRQ